MLRKTTLATIAVLVTSISAIGYAAGTLENDALTSPAAKISLSQAITKAEQHAKGRALRAEYEDSRLGWVYDVEVISGQRVFDVKVDANDGRILTAKADQADHADSDEHDAKD